MTDSRTHGPGVFALLVLVVAAVLLLYLPAVHSLVVLWRDTDATTYTHGFMIAGISLALLWRSRAIHVDIGAGRTPWRRRLAVAGALLTLVLLWQFSFRAGIQIGYLLLLPPLIWCAVRLALGAEAARAAAFPLGFLYFAMPLWDYLNPLAHGTTVRAVRLMLRVVGIPAFFSEDVVQIPFGAFEIEGGCSGLHFIIVALAIAALTGELRGDNLRTRLRWMLIALGLAVFTNWVRVFTIITLGYVSHMQNYIVRVSHYWFGWVLFLVMLIIFFLIERRAASPAREVREPPPQSAGAPPAGRAALVVAAAAICALPWLLNTLIELRSPQGSPPGIDQAASATFGAWRASVVPPEWTPTQLAADREQQWQFVSDGGEVGMYVGWYREQMDRKKLGGFANRPAGDATMLDQSSVTVGDQAFAVQRVERSGQQALIWVQYRVGERRFISATRAQLWYSWLTLRTLRSPLSSVWALRSPCRPDCAVAQAILARFVVQGGNGPWRIAN